MSKKTTGLCGVGAIVTSLLCIIVLLAVTSAANAAFPVPDPPDWWGSPDEFTRLQHHSFHADPNLNQPPDSTYDGFVPSIQDVWTLPGGITYNQDNPSSWGAYWTGNPGGNLNDNIGANLPDGGTLTKAMGNMANEEMIKEFYALVIWSGSEASVDISVSSPETVVEETFEWEGGEAGLFATVLEGTITPQPDKEDFSFAFTGTAFVDEIYVGTHCVPEPSTIAMLCLGAFGLLLHPRRGKK